MDKINWIKQQIIEGITYFEKLNEVIPADVNINHFATYLVPNDRRILMNEYAYRSLLINIDKNDILAIKTDIETLTSTPQLTPQGLGLLNTILTNLEPKTLASIAGYDPVTLEEWNNANTQ